VFDAYLEVSGFFDLRSAALSQLAFFEILRILTPIVVPEMGSRYGGCDEFGQGWNSFFEMFTVTWPVGGVL